MSAPVKQQELVKYIADKTKIDTNAILLVLKHEQAFIDKAKPDAKGNVNIDSDDIVDYVLSRRDVKLDELKVEMIMDAEMDFMMKKGKASYEK